MTTQDQLISVEKEIQKIEDGDIQVSADYLQYLRERKATLRIVLKGEMASEAIGIEVKEL